MARIGIEGASDFVTDVGQLISSGFKLSEISLGEAANQTANALGKTFDPFGGAQFAGSGFTSNDLYDNKLFGNFDLDSAKSKFMSFFENGDGGSNVVKNNFEKVVEGTSNLKHPVLDNIRVGSALKDDFYHSFDDIIDNYAVDAKRFDLPNKKGHMDSLYQVEGSIVKYDTKYVNIKNNAPKMIQTKETINGVFEWVVDPTTNTVTHRTFIPGGGVTGKINQWGK